MATSKRLQLSVMHLLSDAGEPMRTSEIASIVGKSVTATTKALVSAGAVRVPDVRPTEWTISQDNSVATKIVASKFNDEVYMVSSGSTQGLVEAWNAKHKTVGETLSKLGITPTTEPKKLSLQLGTVAGSLAALAYALQSVADKPDWYEILTESE